MGITQVMLGEALAHMGSREEGLKFIDQGIGYYESLVKDGKGIDEKRELMISRQKRADILLMNGDAAGALAGYKEAQAALQVLAKPDPANTMLRIDLADTSFYQGRALTVLGRYGEANDSLQRAVENFESVREAAIASDEYPRGPAAIHVWWGDVFARQSNFRQALQHLKDAITLLNTVKSSDLDDDERCELSTALVKMGQVYIRLGNPEEASSAFQRALDIANPVVALQHGDVPALYPIGEAQTGIAEAANAIAHKSQNPEERSRLANEARAAYQSSLETWSRIPNPSSISGSLFLSNGPPRPPAGMLPTTH